MVKLHLLEQLDHLLLDLRERVPACLDVPRPFELAIVGVRSLLLLEVLHFPQIHVLIPVPELLNEIVLLSDGRGHRKVDFLRLDEFDQLCDLLLLVQSIMRRNDLGRVVESGPAALTSQAFLLFRLLLFQRLGRGHV